MSRHQPSKVPDRSGGRRSAIEYQPINAIIPDDENPREHTLHQIRQIARSITSFGYGSPILVDRAGKVLSGHGRLAALKYLGYAEAPIIRMEHLTPEQARAFSLADNKLSDNSRFNERQLGIHLKALAEVAIDLTFELEDTGFSMAEIDLKIEGLGALDLDEPDPDDDPPPAGPAVSRVLDLWALGPHRILCASALDPGSYDRLLGGERVRATFADPPYNRRINGHVSGKGKRRHREFVEASGNMTGPEFATFLSQGCRMAAEHSELGSVHYWCMDWPGLHTLLAAGVGAYDDLLNICVWVKNNGGMGSLYRSAHEFVAVFRHGDAPHRNNVRLGQWGRNRTNVWSYPGANTFLRSAEDADLLAQHPTPKPVALVADAILDVTARRDLVLDGFIGSGSTLIACERIGRRCRGVELDPLYVDLTIRRWQRLTGESAVRKADGRSFDDLASETEGLR